MPRNSGLVFRPVEPPSMRIQSFLEVPMVEIIVEDGMHSIHVHQNQLSEISPYFTSQIAQAAEKGLSSSINLGEHDVEVVDHFVQWIYHGRQRLFASFSDADPFMRLAELYHFADVREIKHLKNDIIWEMFQRQQDDEVPSMSVVGFAFRNMHPKSNFRILLVAWYTWHLDSHSEHKPTTDELRGSQAFAAELASSLLRKSATQNPFLKNPSTYYHIEQEASDV